MEKIRVKASDFYKLINEVLKEENASAFEISIYNAAVNWDDDKAPEVKHLEVSLLECGGLGNREIADSIKEMTEEEILDIP